MLKLLVFLNVSSFSKMIAFSGIVKLSSFFIHVNLAIKMTKLLIYLFPISLMFLLIGCTRTNEVSAATEIIDFGNLKSVDATELMTICSFVALESSENSLLGNICQIEMDEDY